MRKRRNEQMTKHRLIKTKTWVLLLSIVFVAGFYIGNVQAATPNDQLPTKDELIGFLGTVPIRYNESYVETASSMAFEQHPSWKWDIWQTDDSKMISFYYLDQDSKKGYGSIYLSDMGFDVTKTCKGNTSLLESYSGEEENNAVEEITEVEEVIEEETKNVEEDREEDTDESYNAKEEYEEVIEESIDDKISKMSRGEKIDLVTKLLNMLFGGD
jgi:hypothetical protein